MHESRKVVSQTNPGAGYRELQHEIDIAVQRVLDSGWYVLGQEVNAFEKEFAAWLGTGNAVGCANGTDALALTLRALDIGPGSAVATVSHTAVATIAAIEIVGAVPVLLDIEPDYFTMDPDELATLLRDPPGDLPQIRAVIPVHLYGQAANLEPILALCRDHGIAVVEDCSQAHGACYLGKKLGTFGEAGTFSFYPTKNLGAFGDGGIISTSDPVLAERLTALRQYGWRQHSVSDLVGVSSRLDELQAAILRVKLLSLDTQNQRREVIADIYDTAFGPLNLRLPLRRPKCQHVFHQYVVRTDMRAAVQSRLRSAGIVTGIHYPVPVHLQPAYAGRIMIGPAKCRVTEEIARQVLSLPMFPQLTTEDIERVLAAVCDAVGEEYTS